MDADERPAQAGSRHGRRRWDRTRWAVWGGLAAVLAAGGICLLIELSAARERANRASCMGNVRHVGLAILLYRTGHAGAHPASLAVLLRDGCLPYPWVLKCPSSGRRWPEGLPPADLRWADAESLDRIEAAWSYVLTKGVGKTEAPDLILVYDRPENHRGAGRNCFFSDGHASWLTEADFQERMTEQEARLRDAKKTRE